MLASKFSGRWDDSLEKDKDGDFFIDQDFSTFKPILKYLRNRGNGTEKYSVEFPTQVGLEEGVSLKDVYRMIEYYGMTNGIYPTNLIANIGSKDSVEYIHPKKVNAKEFTTFILSQEGHSRRIKSYEVTLGDDVKRIQIGWKYTSTSRNPRGGGGYAGPVTDVFALDLTMSSFLIDGTGNPIDRLEHKKGTTIRSENFGKEWYIDGELLLFPSSQEKLSALKGVIPLVSIKGEMEITSIQLED